jgi:type I restriction enzyme S subunit
MTMTSAVNQKIPVGYKQTEVGLIPVDWDFRPLGDFFTFKNGLNKAKYFFGHGTPIVNYMDVYKNPGLFSSNILGRVEVSSQEIKSFGVKKGDVFFTRTSETVEEIGISSVLLDELDNGVFSGFILRARSQNDELNDLFKKYCFSSNVVRKQITEKSTYTTRALTNGRVLSMVKIPYPPKTEQLSIATAISDVDALIEKFAKLIEKKKNIKQGAMQELLTGKRRLPGFSGKWETKTLGELLDYEQPTKYLVKDTEYSDNHNTPVLTAGKTFILGYTAEETGIFDKLPVIIFDDFTTAIKFVDFPFKAKSSAMKMLKPKNKEVNLKFVFEKMSLIDFMLGDHKRYWISEYQNIEIDTPKPDEQNAITNVLSDMDSEIAKLESQLSKYKNLKQGMMQNLLTGKIRLIKK